MSKRSFVTIIRSCLTAAALFSSLGASAVDYTDLWAPTNNAPYSITMSHQGNVIVFSVYAYDNNSTAHWYLAVANKVSASTYSGDLLDFQGTPISSGQNGVAPASTKVGTASVTFSSPTTASMSLSINGKAVNSTLTRFTLQTADGSGVYSGGSIGTRSSCPSGNGPDNNLIDFYTLHSGASFQSDAYFYESGTWCSFVSNNYQQVGHLGQMTGTWSCQGGGSGSFAMSEIEFTSRGFTGLVTQNFGGSCKWTGTAGGLRYD